MFLDSFPEDREILDSAKQSSLDNLHGLEDICNDTKAYELESAKVQSGLAAKYLRWILLCCQ